MDKPNADPPSPDDALRTLRAHRRGTIMFDEHFVPLKFVIDPDDGRLVAPVMVAMLAAEEPVLFIPEESDESLQLLISAEPIDGESHPSADRWRIYHGEPQDVRWAAFWIDAARMGVTVYDGDALMAPNPLAGIEPKVCKRLNADKETLGAMCRRVGGMEVADPVCVGLDPDGLDIRARFEILRLPFESRAATPDEAERAIETMREHGEQ